MMMMDDAGDGLSPQLLESWFLSSNAVTMQTLSKRELMMMILSSAPDALGALAELGLALASLARKGPGPPADIQTNCFCPPCATAQRKCAGRLRAQGTGLAPLDNYLR